MSADAKHQAGSDERDARTSRPASANGSDMRGAYDPGGPPGGSGPTALASDHAGAEDVLDVEGATRLLKIGRNTVYELVARNEIPHRRLGKQIRFSRAAIMRWLDPWSSQGAKERQ